MGRRAERILEVFALLKQRFCGSMVNFRDYDRGDEGTHFVPIVVAYATYDVCLAFLELCELVLGVCGEVYHRALNRSLGIHQQLRGLGLMVVRCGFWGSSIHCILSSIVFSNGHCRLPRLGIRACRSCPIAAEPQFLVTFLPPFGILPSAVGRVAHTLQPRVGSAIDRGKQ